MRFFIVPAEHGRGTGWLIRERTMLGVDRTVESYSTYAAAATRRDMLAGCVGPARERRLRRFGW